MFRNGKCCIGGRFWRGRDGTWMAAPAATSVLRQVRSVWKKIKARLLTDADGGEDRRSCVHICSCLLSWTSGEIWTNSQRSTVECVRGASVLSCLLEFSGNFQFPQICLIFLTRLGICELLKTNSIVKNLQVVAVKATTVSSSVVRVDFILCEYNAHWFQLTVGEYWPACSVHSYKPKFNNGCFCTASHKG